MKKILAAFIIAFCFNQTYSHPKLEVVEFNNVKYVSAIDYANQANMNHLFVADKDKLIVRYKSEKITISPNSSYILVNNSIYNLSRNQDFLSDIRQEAFEVDPLDISSLKNGNFAESIFQEAIRFYPPVPFSIRRVMRDTKIQDYPVSSGTYLTISPLLLHHDERYWDNPSNFDPYRFIDPSYTNKAYFPFAGGAHTCIGKFFASYMFKNVIYKYVQNIEQPIIEKGLNIRPTPIPHPIDDVKVSI